MDDQLGLAVTGISSARHNRPASAQNRRAGTPAHQSTKSNIFGIPDSPKQRGSLSRPSSGKVLSPKRSGTPSSKYSTPEAPRGTPPKHPTSAQKKPKLPDDDQYKATTYEPHSKHGELRTQSRGRRAPPGVPILNLGTLSDQDNELHNPTNSKHEPKMKTPDSNSSVSWGTPMKTKTGVSKVVGKDSSCMIHEYNHPKSESRPKPAGMPQLNLQLSHSAGDDQLKKALHLYNEQQQQCEDPPIKQSESIDRNIQEQEISNFAVAQENRVNMYATDGLPGTYPEHVHNKPWFALPPSEQQNIQKHVLEEQDKMQTTRKKQIVEDTVLVDNLSRAAISDPEQTPQTQDTKLDPKGRRHMELFNTRNKTSNAENMLAKRLRFNARIMTKNGRDAHRELNGFFFVGDNTLTVYEFRQFGARSSALPFIQRGNYCHVCGRKQGEPYTLLDMHVGSSLSFETNNQPSLPDTIKTKSLLILKICDVDEETRQNLLFDNCKSFVDRASINKKMEQCQKEDEIEKQKVDRLQASIRRQVAKRGAKTLTGLGKHFRQLDKSGDGLLNKEELQSALKSYHIQVNAEDFERLWNLMDYNKDGALDYGEFVLGMFGEMNEARKQMLRKVFFKLDPNKSGVMRFSDIMKFFIAHRHPKVLSGEQKESDVISELKNSFQHCQSRDEVTYAEFEDYYEGVSLGIERDQEFIIMMRNCWGI